jgi:DNA-binding NarL/FixJ family response regulator
MIDGILTEREAAIAGLVAIGLSNKEIANRLGVSLGTVKGHMHAIFAKTGLNSRVRLVIKLLEKAS